MSHKNSNRNNMKSRNPKVIAYYLPQYHEIPENNEWWGKGFTEWTNVKKAKPFFRGQVQPRVPLNNNYYDLMDKSTIEWQTELANKAGLYGFCYFHYYFKDGRKILEKPAENLLRWKDINQRFCFFWANIEWRRTWSNAKQPATNWSAEGEKVEGDGILLEQDYGDQQAWREHFEYLLPFFQDQRYIKIDGKPVFAIYYLDIIECAEEMFALWDKMAKENGFPGLYLLSVNQDHANNPYINGILHYGNGMLKQSMEYKVMSLPRLIINKISRCLGKGNKIPNILDYKRYWKYLLRDKPYGTIQNFPGATVGYDETPRRGKDSMCLKNGNPSLFAKYLRRQLLRAQEVFGTEYLFLDAWNEWGEGNYLEPDTTYGYGYLKALKHAIGGAKK